MEAGERDKNSAKEEFSGKFDGESMSVTYLREKCEKISAVLYLLSSRIPDTEPVKAKIRDRALEFALSSRPEPYVQGGLMGFSDQGAPSRRAFSVRFRAVAADIVTLLNIAVYGGFVTKMNAGVIIEELATLANFVRKTEEDDLVSGDEHILSIFRTSPALSSESKDLNAFEGREVPRIRPSRASETGVELRRRLILGIIQEKGVVSIKDISAKIKDCSEKTIQRELVSLVASGIVEREGSRRWSVYKMAAANIPAESAGEQGSGHLEGLRESEGL